MRSNLSARVGDEEVMAYVPTRRSVTNCHMSVNSLLLQTTYVHNQCTINMPPQLVRVFRPPEDCDMCRGLRQVDRIANISPANFKKRYTYSGHPVIVTDAMRNWTAQHVFDFRFLKTLYQQLPQAQQSQGCQLIATNSGFANLGEVFNGSHKPNPEPWHIGWRNCDERAAAILRQHYGRPYFLPPSSSDRQKLDWIYLGSSGYRETMHIDMVKRPSWQAQLKGSKRWFLHPPPECYYQCESLEVTVNPGEIIVVDTARWYRETAVVSEDVSVAVGAQFDFT
ncbi:uncharacterized protein [Periplaneta americana]|uniref:uncharacterized protein n=1 Tax=Periplaneta americana TaxID=6978 RepID=UPI0037E99D04